MEGFQSATSINKRSRYEEIFILEVSSSSVWWQKDEVLNEICTNAKSFHEQSKYGNYSKIKSCNINWSRHILLKLKFPYQASYDIKMKPFCEICTNEF